jgi:hypothetical protein
MKVELLLPCLAALLMGYETHAQKAASYMPSNPKLARLEKDNGYQDAHFGADTTDFSNLVFEMQVQDLGETTRIYHRTTDPQEFGQARINELFYNFRDGKLKAITISFIGDNNRKAALAKLTTMYGPGLKRPQGNYWWSTDHVLLSFGDGLDKGESQVSFLYKPGTRKAAKDK